MKSSSKPRQAPDIASFTGIRSRQARYDISPDGRQEFQYSSGTIVPTGAGSAGWLQSVYSDASSVIKALGDDAVAHPEAGHLPRDKDHPVYAVREPFPGKITGTEITFGVVDRYHPLTITSRMTDNGVIFIDGIEANFLAFNSGATATIGIANRQARILYDENHLHRR